MNKRPAPIGESSHANKKHKHGHRQRFENGQAPGASHSRDAMDAQSLSAPYEDALRQLPPQSSKSGPVPAYIPFTVSKSLPALPEVSPGPLSTAPFTHRSVSNYNRSVGGAPSDDLTYERLEFLGDAYIEVMATRLIFERYAHLPAGQQSQLREVLVKNETLGEYSRAYGFDRRVQAGNIARMVEEGKHKGNKGFNKILGDVFEAYVAAVVLSDHEEGFAVAEKWLTALWAPKLLEVSQSDASIQAARSLTHADAADPLHVYNPNAKNELQKRVYLDKTTKLVYDKYKDSVELKGNHLGQNRHFIALYFSGYGYDSKLLGKGEGKNKVEAGNWAATEAMHGECKGIVEECEAKLKEMRAERDARTAAEEAA